VAVPRKQENTPSVQQLPLGHQRSYHVRFSGSRQQVLLVTLSFEGNAENARKQKHKSTKMQKNVKRFLFSLLHCAANYSLARSISAC